MHYNLIVLALIAGQVGWAQEAKDGEKPRSGLAAKSNVRFVVSNHARLKIEVTATRLFEPVRLTIHFKNSSRFDVYSELTNVFWDYDVRVLDQDGKEPERTAAGKKLLSGEYSGSSQFVKLQPGEEVVDVIDLTRIYNFSHGGAYMVTVNREVRSADPEKPKAPLFERAYSAPLEFVIRP